MTVKSMLVIACLCALAGSSDAGSPLGTGFTYQGVLESGGSPYSGTADLRFALFDAASAGNQVGATLDVPGATIVDGLFTTTLDFGAVAFNGDERWLQIEVRAPAGGGAYVALSPRQRLTAAPYALRAMNVANPSPFVMQGNDALFSPSGYLRVNGNGAGGGLRVTGDGGAIPIIAEYLSTVFTSPAIIGKNIAKDGWGSGVYGEGSQVGVQGRANPGNSGSNNGVRMGVYGEAGVPNQDNVGVQGVIALVPGTGTRTGVFGGVSGGGTANYGVRGMAPDATNSWAGYFDGHAYVSGSLGVGTSTPIAKLQVAGGLAIDGDLGNLSLRGIGGTESARLQRLDLSGAGLMISDFKAGPIQFATSTIIGAAGERMRVTPEGNVGIGTTSPTAKLQVAGDVSLLADGFGLSLLGFSNNLTGRINRIDLPGAGLTIADHATGPIIFATSPFMGAAGERMRVTADGFVGIGSTNPTTGLQVEGAGFPKAFVTVRSSGGNGEAGVRLDRDGTTFWHLFNSASTSDTFNLRNNAFGVVLAATQAGNVGIGTDVPGAFRLAVNGTAANSTGSWSIFSDARLKVNVRDLPEGTLDKLLSLRGRNFEYTREARRNNYGEDGPQTGFIAQEVQQVFPEWVAENRDGYLFITERGTTALMVEALRDLRLEKDEQIKKLADQAKGMSDAITVQTGLIIELREDVTTLRDENKELRARIAAIEKIVEAMLPESPTAADVPASNDW